MFANYDYNKFPIVKVTFNGTIINEQDFILFTEQWLQLYEDKKEFTFIFDVKDIGLINPYWSYKVATFISQLKEQPKQYLRSSKIIHANSFTMYLLWLVFTIQVPVSIVTLVSNDNIETIIYP